MYTGNPFPTRVLGDIAKNAAAGEVGEYVRNTLLTSAPIALTTNLPTDIVNLILSAGDWDVSGVVDWVFAATTSYTVLQAAISIAGPSGGFGAGIPPQAGLLASGGVLLEPDSVTSFSAPATVPGANPFSTPIGPVRITIPATNAPYIVGLLAQATFTVAALSVAGTIRARRVQ